MIKVSNQSNGSDFYKLEMEALIKSSWYKGSMIKHISLIARGFYYSIQ